MFKRYFGIGAFTFLTGLVFAAAFQFFEAWDAVGDRRVAVMAVAAFALAAAILMFRSLTMGRDWDPPANVAFIAAAVVLISLMVPWGDWLLLASIPLGGLVTVTKLSRVVRDNLPKKELGYSVMLFVQFMVIMSVLVMWGIR
jgi:hypothetical protein